MQTIADINHSQSSYYINSDNDTDTEYEYIE